MKRRKFHSGEVNHVYQRTLHGNNIFYDIEDYLVYYTIFSVTVAKYPISVLGLCLMVDHLHILLVSEIMSDLSLFMDHVTSVFVREYNRAVGRKGPLFEPRFGSAPKTGLKKVRTAVSYLFNNPVERFLCLFAQDYRWNFLAYGKSSHPFSQKINLMKSSRALKSVVSEIRVCHAKGLYLNYQQLRRIFAKIADDNEKEQLIDYIIWLYRFIDYDKLSSYYNSYDDMVVAINTNTGSEYELNETFAFHTDGVYRDMIKCVREYGYMYSRHVTVAPESHKLKLLAELKRKTRASAGQIRKFLHLPLDGHGHVNR